jgi:hypothetical protein
VAVAPVPSMPPLVLIAHDDPGTADALRHAVEGATGWQVLMADPSHVGLTAALASGPSVALIGCAALANLPSGCRTPLVAIGDDDRPADVRAALAAGARSLLAWPDGVADLPGELARLVALDLPGAAGGLSGLVVAARGVQGGAGTTTVAVHLAAAWARWGPAPVLLLDLAGGLAFRLDLVAAPTWSTLLPAIDPGDLDVDAPDLGVPDLVVRDERVLDATVWSRRRRLQAPLTQGFWTPALWTRMALTQGFWTPASCWTRWPSRGPASLSCRWPARPTALPTLHPSPGWSRTSWRSRGPPTA